MNVATRGGHPGWSRVAGPFALLTLLATGCAIQPNDNTLPGQVATGEDGYTVEVHFEGVENLVPNSQVLMDDVVIGTVASLEVRDWQAVAEIRLKDSVPVSTRAQFTIGQKTLLGAQYVDVKDRAESVEPAGTTLLEHGDVVPADRTGRAPATEQILSGVALLLNNGGLSQISTITGELTTALGDREVDARDLITRSNELVEVLDGNRDDIVRALESMDRLSEGLAGDRDRIDRAIEQVTPGLLAVEQERRRLVKALTTSGRASERAVDVIRTSRRALLANLEALNPILSNLGKVSRRLPEALKIAVTIPFPAMTTEKTLRGDYSNLFATIDLSAESVTDLLLGSGTLPSLQSGNPLRAPLESTPPGGGTGGAGPQDRGDVPGAGRAPTDKGDDGDDGNGAGSCLLGLLGDC